MFSAEGFKVLLSCQLSGFLFFAGVAGAAPLFADDFDAGAKKPRDGAVGWASTSRAAVSDDVAHSGRYSLKFTFEGKPAGEDAWAEQRFALGGDYQEVEVRWYAYYPNGKDGLGPRFEQRPESPGNNKFIRLWKGDETDGNNGYSQYLIKLGASTWPTGQLGDSSIGPEYGLDRGGVGLQGLPRSDDFITDKMRGRWVQFRYIARVSSAVGKNDGAIRLYADGALVINAEGLPLYSSHPDRPALNYGYLLGWANTGFDSETYVYVDDVEIYATSAARPREPAGVKVD